MERIFWASTLYLNKQDSMSEFTRESSSDKGELPLEPCAIHIYIQRPLNTPDPKACNADNHTLIITLVDNFIRTDRPTSHHKPRWSNSLQHAMSAAPICMAPPTQIIRLKLELPVAENRASPSGVGRELPGARSSITNPTLVARFAGPNSSTVMAGMSPR